MICQVNGFAYTRLCPIYHSTFPEAVGPVRSLRPVDVPLLAPIKPVVANTGAADWVLNYIDDHAKYLLTSVSTGLPKAVICLHRGIAVKSEQIAA